MKILKNDSERAGAKELLNNVWGLFGKKPNKPITEIVQDASCFHEILTSDCCCKHCSQPFTRPDTTDIEELEQLFPNSCRNLWNNFERLMKNSQKLRQDL